MQPRLRLVRSSRAYSTLPVLRARMRRDAMDGRRLSRRGLLSLGARWALAAPWIVGAARAQARTVYVNSYGGVWETAWRKAFFDPFTAQTGIQIKTVPGVS